MVDGTDKHAGMDGDQGKRAAGKKGKKDDLENLKKEVEMVSWKKKQFKSFIPHTFYTLYYSYPTKCFIQVLQLKLN